MIGNLIKSLFGGGSESEVELPEWIGLILHSEDDLLKGAGHKYIRRVPTGNPKKPWRYFYKVSGGEGLGHHSEFVEGAAFKVAHNGKEGHFHILGVEGDKLRIKHDESGEESTLTKDALTSLLHKEHAQAISEHKERLKKELVAVAKHGSEKQKAKIQSEASKAGVSKGSVDKQSLLAVAETKLPYPIDTYRILAFQDDTVSLMPAETNVGVVMIDSKGGIKRFHPDSWLRHEAGKGGLEPVGETFVKERYLPDTAKDITIARIEQIAKDPDRVDVAKAWKSLIKVAGNKEATARRKGLAASALRDKLTNTEARGVFDLLDAATAAYWAPKDAAMMAAEVK